MARGNGATARASTIPAGLFPTRLCRRSGNLFPPLGGHTFGSRLSALAPECHGSRVLALLGGAPHDVDGVADHVGRTALAFGTSGHILYPCALLSAKHIINRGQKRGCVMPIVPLLQEAAFDPEATARLARCHLRPGCSGRRRTASARHEIDNRRYSGPSLASRPGSCRWSWRG